MAAMATPMDPDATPGTLKAALAVWMLAMAGLLGYSIATAEPSADEPHAPSDTTETPRPVVPVPTLSSPAPIASAVASVASTLTASPAADAWVTCTALPGVRIAYPSDLLEPEVGDDCGRLGDARTTGRRIAVLFQMEDVSFADKMAALRAENNEDATGELQMRSAGGHPAGVISYRRDASTYVDCPGASIEYVYYVEAPQGQTLDAVAFSCEDGAEEMRAVHGGIVQRLRYV